MSAYQRFSNRVKETSTTTGTGDITLLGAVAQFSSFASRVPVGDMFPYAIVGQTGTEWEIGRGEMLTTTTFARRKIEESSNSDRAVNFSSGTKDVFLTFPASIAHDVLTLGQGLAARSGLALP